ncbi:MAG: response regulator, partial [Chloroflexi bacterium]|nr:response regulator [Chloroflexota bacterium]
MPHLLLVDDNADHLFLTRRALRGVGMECTGVQTAEAAVEAIRGAPYDMILLDHNLPGMKGSELIARIRSLGIDTPVIMVTGGGSEQLAVDALKAGALDYIVKTEGYLTALPPRIQRALTQHGLASENRQLEAERQAAVAQVTSHARRLRALQQASLKINSSLRPRDVRSQAVNQAAALLESEMAAFFL